MTALAAEEDHSPTPLPMCGFAWTDDRIKAVGHPFDPMHVCKSTTHGDLRPHQCGQCGATNDHSPTPADEVREAVDEALDDIDEALVILDRMTHSRRITDRLLEQPRTVLFPTEVIPSVQRAPGLDAIATAVQRLVRRMSKEIDSSSTTAWRLELPTLEIRIATRLEDAGLSPAAALRAAHAITGDVRSEAGFAEEFIRTRVTDVVEADVARNLLPRISKLLKEPHHG